MIAIFYNAPGDELLVQLSETTNTTLGWAALSMYMSSLGIEIAVNFDKFDHFIVKIQTCSVYYYKWQSGAHGVDISSSPIGCLALTQF